MLRKHTSSAISFITTSQYLFPSISLLGPYRHLLAQLIILILSLLPLCALESASHAGATLFFLSLVFQQFNQPNDVNLFFFLNVFLF